ncbi:hypothetical protein [Candidatus Borrarchaeum sp.]|uniref:prenylated flavin chaperone LpdD n=1 Tax=Candidatus Borrarchaeum sp. TaxID=2846742 RepID=UPI00257E68A7|nr:hypothetical protein [Candidatus Borrarchaeum sp.]
MKNQFNDTIDEGKFKVNLHAITSGDDLTVIIGGGVKPHIGSVVIACPNKSKNVNYTIWTDEGHKDNVIAEDIATELMKNFDFDKNVVVIAGLHIDHATKEDINRLVKNSNSLVENLLVSDFFKGLLI